MTNLILRLRHLNVILCLNSTYFFLKHDNRAMVKSSLISFCTYPNNVHSEMDNSDEKIEMPLIQID